MKNKEKIIFLVKTGGVELDEFEKIIYKTMSYKNLQDAAYYFTNSDAETLVSSMSEADILKIAKYIKAILDELTIRVSDVKGMHEYSLELSILKTMIERFELIYNKKEG